MKMSFVPRTKLTFFDANLDLNITWADEPKTVTSMIGIDLPIPYANIIGIAAAKDAWDTTKPNTVKSTGRVQGDPKTV